MAYFNTDIFNQTRPNSWTPYDMVARKVAKSIGPWDGTYVITPSVSRQVFLTSGKTFEKDLVVEPITLELILLYFQEIGFGADVVYQGPYIWVVGVDDRISIPTENKFLYADVEVQGPILSIASTVNTSGYTVSVS